MVSLPDGVYYALMFLMLPALLLVFNISLFADGTEADSLDFRKVYDIEGILVSGASLDRAIGKVDIKETGRERVNTDTSISDLMQDMAGVLLTERGKGESIVRFRGFEDRHIRVFINGMPVSNGYFGNYDLHLMPGSNVSRIYLIKGPVSHQFGFNTMGGILNIITDDLNEANVLNSNVQYSSHGRANASLNGSYALGRSQIYLSGSYLNTPGFILPRRLKTLEDESIEQDGERRINSHREQYTINMRYITDIAGIHIFTLTSGYSYMPEKGNPPSIYDHPDNTYSKIEDWGKFNTSLSARSFLLEDFEITASAYYYHSEDTYIRFDNALFENALWRSIIKNNTMGLHLNLKHLRSRYFNNEVGIRSEIKGYDRKGGPGYESVWVDNTQSMAKVYHSVRYPAEKENYSVILGNALSSFNHSQIDDYKFYWEPQAGLTYHYENKTLSLAYGISKQFPTMRELFSSSSGNVELEPETAQKLEAAFLTPLTIKRWEGELSLTIFYNRINDLIRRDRTQYYNLEKMSIYGSEVNLNWSLLPSLTHDYELSLLKLDSRNSSVDLMEYPELKVRLTHRIFVSEKFRLNLTSQWYDESLTFYRDEDYYTLPSYWIQELNIIYFHRWVNLSLNIKNLFDRYYEPQYGYPAAGREITFAMEIPVF